MNARPIRRKLTGLIAVNAVLLAVLAAVTFAPTADAQMRVRGSYTMVAGGAKGASSGIVYIVDTTNHELIAVTYKPNQRELFGIGYRNLVADSTGIAHGGQQR